MDWIPWGNRATDWTNALTSGKGGPDITELGNTDTPGVAAQGALADITSEVKSWSSGSDLIAGNLANDTVGRQDLRRAVVRRRARHLVPQGPVRQGRHLRAARPPGPSWSATPSC